MTTLLFKQKAYDIIGVCIDVYNTLGYGFSEVVYKDAMEIEFLENGIDFYREKEYVVLYKGKRLKRTFNTDFTISDKIIVEVKAHPDGVKEEAIVQTINYLKASGVRLGLIINFGRRKLEYKRVVF
ncbi:MAG TPA: GxxExxY protein [Chitinophagaceae bacterium]|nr:GxxExxY protein [Chitinophagaceae bacterium]